MNNSVTVPDKKKDGISRSQATFRSTTGLDLLLDPRIDINIGDIYEIKEGETELIYTYSNLKDVVKPRGITGDPLLIETIKFVDDHDYDSDFSTLNDKKLKFSFLFNMYKTLQAKITGKFENINFSKLKFYFKDTTRERIKSSGELNKILTMFSLDPSAYNFQYRNSYWIIIDRVMSKRFAICSLKSDKNEQSVLVEFAKQFDASAGRNVTIDGRLCFSSPKNSQSEFVFAVKFAHLNNQLARTDIYVDPTAASTTSRLAPTGTGPRALAMLRTSGGFSETYPMKLKGSRKKVPTFYNVLEINETIEPINPGSMLDLKRKEKVVTK